MVHLRDRHISLMELVGSPNHGCSLNAELLHVIQVMQQSESSALPEAAY